MSNTHGEWLDRIRGRKAMDELKPCPFCGSKASLNERHELGTWIVECSNGTCPASYMIGWDYDTPAEAIEAWNRRASDG